MQVLEQADDCYCVLLQLAHGPAVVAAERSSRAQAHPTPLSESHSSTLVSPAMHPGATPTSSAHATTFLHDAFHAQHDAAFADPQLALDSHAQSSTSTNPGAQYGDKHSTIANPAAGHTTLFAAYVSHATVQAHMASKACTPGSTASGWPRGSQRDGRLQGPSLMSKLLAATGLSKAGLGLEQKGHSRPMGQHIQQDHQQRKDSSSRSFGPQEVIMIGPNQVGCASVAATEVACSGASVPQHLQSHSDWESKAQHAGTAAAADGNVGNGGRGSDSNDGSCNRAGDRFDDDGGGDVSGSGGCGVGEAGDWSHVRLGLRCALMSLSLPQAALLTQLLAPWANGA